MIGVYWLIVNCPTVHLSEGSVVQKFNVETALTDILTLSDPWGWVTALINPRCGEFFHCLYCLTCIYCLLRTNKLSACLARKCVWSFSGRTLGQVNRRPRDLWPRPRRWFLVAEPSDKWTLGLGTCDLGLEGGFLVAEPSDKWTFGLGTCDLGLEGGLLVAEHSDKWTSASGPVTSASKVVF